jgi:predicted MFS family arabinose efflux permease
VATLALYASVLGALIPAIRGMFPGLTLGAAGLFSTLQSFGTALSVILCFCLLSALNKVRIMALSQLLLAVSVVLFGLSHELFVLYALLPFIGLFSNIVDTMSNAVLADLLPQRKGFHIGLLQALWSAAGAAGPWFALLLGGKYTPVFVGLGLLMAAGGVVFAAGLKAELRLPLVQRRDNFGALGKLVRTFRIKGIGLVSLTSFFNSFVQLSMIFFVSSYVLGIGGSGAQAALMLSMMFAGMLAGRVVYARVSHRFSVRAIMTVSNALAFAAYTGMLLCPDLFWAGLLAAVGGFGASPNFPALVVEACGIVPGDTASATALVFLGYTLACFVAPPVVGAIGDAAGLKTALQCVAALSLAVAALSARLGTAHFKKPAS